MSMPGAFVCLFNVLVLYVFVSYPTMSVGTVFGATLFYTCYEERLGWEMVICPTCPVCFVTEQEFKAVSLLSRTWSPNTILADSFPVSQFHCIIDNSGGTNKVCRNCRVPCRTVDDSNQWTKLYTRLWVLATQNLFPPPDSVPKKDTYCEPIYRNCAN